MNVLGKIKSKKQNAPKTQYSQIQETKSEEKNEQTSFENNKKFETQSYQSQIPIKNKVIQNNEQKRIIRPMKPVVQQVEYLMNTNVLMKNKQTAIKSKQSPLMKTTNSPSNNFFPSFQTNKPSKNLNSIVYFDSNPSCRTSTFLSDSNTTTNQRKKNNRVDSYGSEQQMNVDFDFLLSNKQKNQVRKSMILSKGKIQNEKQIQNELKAQNQQVLCFYLKKWTTCGDILMIQGQVESLKRGFIEMDLYQTKRKVYNKFRIKLSCGRDIISSPQAIGRIYVSKIYFLSQTQGMIVHQDFLRVIEKRRKFNK